MAAARLTRSTTDLRQHFTLPSSMNSPIQTRLRAAFTLVELVTTVAIMAILTAIAIPVYSNLNGASEEAVANDHVEALNRAVTNFAHACWKMPTAADASSTTDEFAVVRSLQYRFPATQMKPGSPFFSPEYAPSASSNSREFRVRWNGKSFELLKPGQSGTGLKFNKSGDFGSTAYTFPSNYKPEGAN